ncbi:MAG: hypothetical protein IJ654_05335 [Bacteroidales bacterium]|nr:hypothetical protein [Bacteroidales bacterium]
MACSQTLSGLIRDCAGSVGGILEVLLANADDVSAITVANDKVTAITMVASAKFHRYAIRRGNGSLNSAFTVDDTSGNKFVTSEILMQFNRMETTKRIEIMALARADLIGIVKDANGLYWLVGDADHPLGISAGEGPTGTAISDRNYYGITLQTQNLELPVEVQVGTDGVDLSAIVA